MLTGLRKPFMLEIGCLSSCSLRQSTLTGSPYHKLTSRYFGPYPIVEKVGVVAYKLLLPPEVLIHPTFFHISQPTIFYNLSSEIVHPLVLHLTIQLCPFSEAILARCLIKKGNKVVVQCLIKWSNLDVSYATWELASALRA